MIEIIPVFFILLHNSADFVLFATAPTGTSVGGGEKKLRFLEKKPRKNFVSSRNCRTFALAFGKKSGGRAPEGRLPGPHEEAVFDILQTATRQRPYFR